MTNLLCYKVIYFRPNTSRNFKMAAMKTLFDHLIVPINPNAMMTTYVSSLYSLSSDMFSNILAQMHRHSPKLVEQSNPALRQEHRIVSHPILQLHRTTFSNAFGTTSMLSFFIARQQLWTKPWSSLPYLHLKVNTEAMVLDSWWCRRTVFKLATFWWKRCNLSLPCASSGWCRTRFTLR